MIVLAGESIGCVTKSPLSRLWNPPNSRLFLAGRGREGLPCTCHQDCIGRSDMESLSRGLWCHLMLQITNNQLLHNLLPTSNVESESLQMAYRKFKKNWYEYRLPFQETKRYINRIWVHMFPTSRRRRRRTLYSPLSIAHLRQRRYNISIAACVSASRLPIKALGTGRIYMKKPNTYTILPPTFFFNGSLSQAVRDGRKILGTQGVFLSTSSIPL